MDMREPSGTRMQKAGLIAGPLLAILLLLFFDLEPGRPAVTRTAAVALLMAVWWMTEAVPLAATALGVAIQVDPLLLMIPATLSCSFAFMLPVATPPNAIVFGTDRVRITDMARVGLILNLMGVAIVAGAIYTLGGSALGIELTGLPDWAK